jgi:hypothetical protein
VCVAGDVEEDDIDVGYAAIGGETPRDVARSTSKDKDKWSDSEEDSSAVYSKVKVCNLLFFRPWLIHTRVITQNIFY